MTTHPPGRPALSDAELELLKRLWDLGTSTVREIHGAVEAAGSEWAYTTVQTMLSRMEEKGYVKVDRGSYAHAFSAAVSRGSLLDQRVRQLEDDLGDGAAASLLLHLAEGRTFSATEIARFRTILDEAERRAAAARRPTDEAAPTDEAERPTDEEDGDR